MINLNIKFLIFITFIIFNISFSLSQESVSNSSSIIGKEFNNQTFIQQLNFLQNEGSIENISSGSVPHYLVYAINDSWVISPYSINMSLFSGEPSYRLGVQSNNINENEYFCMDVWIIGLGDSNLSRISIKIPFQLVVYPIDIISTDYYLYLYNINFNNETFDISPIPVLILNRYNNTTNIERKVPQILFTPAYNKSEINYVNYGGMVVRYNYTQEKIITFTNESYKLPKGADEQFYVYKILFKINKDAPPGDYLINLDLFYKGREKWYVDSQSVPVHVNYLYEFQIVQLLVITLATLGVFCELDGRYRILAHMRSLWNTFLLFIRKNP